MNDAYERRCRLLLRAYPARYRHSRGDELLGTLLDAAEPGAKAPSFRESWDVVRGGLLFRLRDRPPVHWWLAYRLLNVRVPARYRWWARDDIMGRGYFARQGLAALVLIALAGLATYGIADVIGSDDLTALLRRLLPSAAAGLIVGFPPSLLYFRGLTRRQKAKALARHEFDPYGTPLTSPHSMGDRR